MMPVRFQPTVRLRLTLLYGGLFFLTGALLLGLNYALVRRALTSQPPTLVRITTTDLIGPDGQQIDASRATGLGGDDGPPRDLAQRFRQVVIDQTLHEVVVQSAVALGLMGVVAGGLGWVVAGRVLRPLQQVTATAKRLSEANLHERIAMQGPRDELRDLADTIDAMLARLDRSFDSQRRFVANASHELRTPLTIMRTEIDVTLADPDATTADLRAMDETVRDATERSERLIASLLLLARGDRGVQERVPVDLADATAVALAGVRVEGCSLGLRVEARLEPACVGGDPALIERLVANLVENAVRHNREEGWISLATGTREGRAWLRVRNSGGVIPCDEIEGLFEPFRRGPHGRTAGVRGVGLGLSIVRSIVTAHGGEIRAHPVEGGGLEVEVELERRGG
ncbi:MAG: HAMP domain-containing histidine kinase [Chloroflexi bacterium]|nr:HAMP domain-containing histidine kinase [Chloroflexota bacterium]